MKTCENCKFNSDDCIYLSPCESWEAKNENVYMENKKEEFNQLRQDLLKISKEFIRFYNVLADSYENELDEIMACSVHEVAEYTESIIYLLEP